MRRSMIVVLAAAAVAYAGSFRCGWHLDDNHTIVQNEKIDRISPAIRNLIREEKVHQIYSQMQMGQSKFEMQTMNQSLCDLFLRKMIGYEDAIARSSAPDELNEMIAGKDPSMEMGASATGTYGARPQKPPRTQYRNR